MAVFKAGQRVRIRWSNGWPYLAGKTGVVVGPGTLTRTKEPCLRVNPDCWPGGVAPPGGHKPGGWFGAKPEFGQIEPLVPEGMQPVEWENCLWQPAGEKVT